MRICLLKDLTVTTKDGQALPYKAGAMLSVWHRIGRKLIYGLNAKWVSAETGDPLWLPIPSLRMAVPSHDKMLRSAMVNK